MTNLTPIEPKDVLQRATAALREQAAGSTPPAEVVTQTMRVLMAESKPAATQKVWAMNKFKFAAAAAGIAAIVIVGVVLWIVQSSLPPAFAAVVEKMKAAQSVRYQENAEESDPEHGKTSYQSWITLVGSEWRISETLARHEGLSDVRIKNILNRRLGRMLQLNPNYPSGKIAILTEVSGLNGQKNWNPIDELQRVDTRGARDLGDKTVAGRKAHGYLLAEESNVGTTTLWVDQETLLPLEIETEVAESPLMQSSKKTLRATNFEWNVKVDENQLTLSPPADYELINVTVDGTQSGEAAVIRALEAFAEVSAGHFADSFGPDWKRDSQNHTRTFKSDDERKAAMTDNLRKSIRISVLRQYAFNFMGKASNGTDWHYAGKGAKLGDKDRPIMWYKPAGKETYRVIDAELNVHDIPANDLPKIDSVPMTQPAK